jgi:hypothetical protein
VHDADDLVNQLDRHDPRLLDELALQAMLLFERSREQGTSHAQTPRVRPDVQAVKQALIDLVDRSGRCPTAILAPLGALRDPRLVPLLKRCLLYQLADQNAGGVYAAMNALDESGEHVFGGRLSRSIQDWELNRDIASTYLARHQETDRP